MLFNAQQWLVDRHVAEGRGENVAVIAPSGTLTYAQLSALCGRVAAGLRSLHLHRDDRVVLVTNDEVAMVAGILGTFRAGFVAVPVSTMLGGRELGAIVEDSAADALIVSAEYADAAVEAAAMCPDLEYLICDGGTAPEVPGLECLTFADLLARGQGAPPALHEVAATAEDEWALSLYTSGTTGSPKGAMHRHVSIRHIGSTYPNQVLKMTEDDRCLSIAKMFFSYGIGNSLFFPLACGATTILEPRRPTPQVFAERIRQDKPTIFDAVPTFFASMLAADLPADTLASVRFAASAGEPLPAELQQRFIEHFGVPILDGLGATEFLNIYLSNSPTDMRPGTVGKPTPGYEVDIRDEDGYPIPRGEPGTAWVRGESMALGYWRNAQASRQVFVGEWANTGDSMMRDQDGYYICLGRTNDLIKAGGIYVSPGEVENRLIQHHAVAEVTVVGMPDSDGLIKPVAAVVPARPVRAEELVQWCREGLAAFKRPRRIVFVDELPKTATGKMQRFKVRQMIENLEAAQAPDARIPDRPQGSAGPADS